MSEEFKQGIEHRIEPGYLMEIPTRHSLFLMIWQSLQFLAAVGCLCGGALIAWPDSTGRHIAGIVLMGAELNVARRLEFGKGKP